MRSAATTACPTFLEAIEEDGHFRVVHVHDEIAVAQCGRQVS
jgi:hypothetical protein